MKTLSEFCVLSDVWIIESWKRLKNIIEDV